MKRVALVLLLALFVIGCAALKEAADTDQSGTISTPEAAAVVTDAGTAIAHTGEYVKENPPPIGGTSGDWFEWGIGAAWALREAVGFFLKKKKEAEAKVEAAGKLEPATFKTVKESGLV